MKSNRNPPQKKDAERVVLNTTAHQPPVEDTHYDPLLPVSNNSYPGLSTNGTAMVTKNRTITKTVSKAYTTSNSRDSQLSVIDDLISKEKDRLETLKILRLRKLKRSRITTPPPHTDTPFLLPPSSFLLPSSPPLLPPSAFLFPLPSCPLPPLNTTFLQTLRTNNEELRTAQALYHYNAQKRPLAFASFTSSKPSPSPKTNATTDNSVNKKGPKMYDHSNTECSVCGSKHKQIYHSCPKLKDIAANNRTLRKECCNKCLGLRSKIGQCLKQQPCSTYKINGQPTNLLCRTHGLVHFKLCNNCPTYIPKPSGHSMMKNKGIIPNTTQQKVTSTKQPTKEPTFLHLKNLAGNEVLLENKASMSEIIFRHNPATNLYERSTLRIILAEQPTSYKMETI
jgi:hypothetical protein